MRHSPGNWRRLVAAVLYGLSTACTTLSPVVTDPAGPHIRAEVKAGDNVHAAMGDGTAHSLQVSAVGEASLVGVAVRAKDSTDVAIATGGGSHSPGYNR